MHRPDHHAALAGGGQLFEHGDDLVGQAGVSGAVITGDHVSCRDDGEGRDRLAVAAKPEGGAFHRNAGVRIQCHGDAVDALGVGPDETCQALEILIGTCHWQRRAFDVAEIVLGINDQKSGVHVIPGVSEPRKAGT